MASIGNSRTLKLTILGDVDQLKKSLNAGADDVDGFTGKVEKFGKMAGAAFIAAGVAAAAYAVKIGVDGVKAAIEDEQAQVKLASALKNATGATEKQIDAVEASILKMSLATGVADDKLRPAFARLSLSTNDIAKSQQLLALALDISTQTGKPLEAVANSLGKAFDGNTAALGKLGIGLTSAELKTMSFEQVQSKLTDLFGGAAAANAETYQGRIDRLKVTFDETKETIGNALLPILDKFLKFITDTIIPNVSKFIALFDPLKQAVMDNKETFEEFGAFLSKYIVPVLVDGIGGAIAFVAKVAGTVVNVIANIIKTVENLISGAIDGINYLISKYNSIPLFSDIPLLKAPSFSSGASTSVPSVSLPSASTIKLPSASSASGGVGVSGGSSGSSSSSAALLKIAMKNKDKVNTIIDAVAGAFDKGASGTNSLAGIAALSNPAFQFGTSGVNTNSLAGIAAASRTTINLTVNGAVDSEGTARTIVDTLNNSFYRGSGGGASLVVA